MCSRISNCTLSQLCVWVAVLIWALSTAVSVPAQRRDGSVAKPRVVITADPELDDNNTIIRAILYSSDVKFEGLVYASSQFHWRGDKKGTTQYIAGREYTRLGLCPCTSWRFAPDEHFIENIVSAYAKAYPNLKIHNPDYPSPDNLKSKIKLGNVDFEGDFSKDTDGSNLIKSLLLDDAPGPLYVTAQGGESTIARALKSIRDQYANTSQWEDIREKVASKLIIVPTGDQDDTDASYIRPNWPGVRKYQFMGVNFGYGAQDHAASEEQIYFSPEWTLQNISSRGPLGALYRVWGDGKQMVKGDRMDYFGLSGYTARQLADMGYMVWMPPHPKGSFLGEGDTPTFLNLIDIGLRAYENPQWGGWGGWMIPGVSAFPSFSSTPAPILPADTSGVARGLAPARGSADTGRAPKGGSIISIDFHGPPVAARTAEVSARFFAAAQNDFAARMLWSVTRKFNEANHPPKVSIKGPLDTSAAPGSTVRLQGEVSDPDHDTITTRWWQYRDAGTYPGDITLSDPAALATTFRVPDNARPGQTIHIILEATDSGTPRLTRYQRVIVTVQ